MLECNLNKNKTLCTCSYEPCSRKGKCCECIIYHKKASELPGCFFPTAAERTYDRSIENFIKSFKNQSLKKP